MASLELVLSESEWQNLLSFKEYVKQSFDVDIFRKDELYSASVEAEGPLSPVHQASIQTDSTNSFNYVSPILSFSGNGINADEYILRPPPVIVQIQTKNSPSTSTSNLEKCRKFAIAFSPSNPDFKFETINLESPQSLEMVKAYLPNIQQSTSTLINHIPNTTDIAIQGHRSCVELAQCHITTILRDLKTNPSEKQDNNNYNNHNLKPVLTLSSPITNDSLIENSCDKNDDNLHLSMFKDRLSPLLVVNNIIASPAKSDDVFFPDNCEYNYQYDDLYNFSNLSKLVHEENDNPVYTATLNKNDPPFQAYTHSYQHNIQKDDDSDSDEDNILADDRFSNRINQATKLGFSEEQVIKVLKRLGVNSNMDDMMRELVSDPHGGNTEDGMMRLEDFDRSDTNLSSKEEDNDDNDSFDVNDSSNLRHIIIDGSNVAMSHGQKVFSCMGIKIVVDWFKNRGHKNITAFVPQWRKEASRPDAPITNQEILTELETEKIVVFTPSRRVGGTRIVCYDDRFVLQLAVQNNGIVVSNDVYRDLVRERDDFKEVVEKRLLMYSFVQDMFMPPEDPLGRQGPSLDNFLRIRPSEPKNKPQNCPYGKKCTYGNKCRFYHPERRYAPQKMVAEKLKENAELKMKSSKVGKSLEPPTDKAKQPKQKLVRTVSLVPQELVNSFSDGISIDKTKKPPLHHSKSMVYPSSYLNDLRLKMEQAESAEAFQQTPSASMAVNHHDQNLDQIQSVEVDSKDTIQSRKQRSISCNPSPCTSPTPKTESMKTKLKAVRSFPSSPVPNQSPSFAVNDVKSSLNIPNPEPQDRYLSGHLLVAKKLSDEDNSSGNFFSQHSSRAPSLSQEENQTILFDGRLHSSDSNTSLVSPMSKVPTSQQGKNFQDSCPWKVREIYIPPEITRSSKTASPTNSLLPHGVKENSSSVHSYIVPSCGQYDSCPTFSEKDEAFQSQNHYKRSLSSSIPPQSGEHMNHAARKFSLNAINIKAVENIHAKLKPHSSVPLNQHIPFNQNQNNNPAFQPHYQRSRMSIDSGICSGGLSTDYHISNNSPFSPTENYSLPFSDNSSMSSPRVFSPSTQTPARFMMQQQQQELMHGSNPVCFSATSSPWQFSPLPNRMQPSFHDQSAMSHKSAVSVSNMAPCNQNPLMYNSLPTSANPMSNYISPPPLTAYQQQFYAQPIYPSPMPNMDGQFYPMATHCAGGGYVPYSPSTPSSPFVHQPPPFQPAQPKVIDEEADISVDDPRHSAYYNLSSVFGERVVRTFMNRNPDVKNFKELYTLISSYKQDTGM